MAYKMKITAEEYKIFKTFIAIYQSSNKKERAIAMGYMQNLFYYTIKKIHCQLYPLHGTIISI
jgi:hypothetical protein